MFYLVNRPEGSYFKVASDVDPVYAEKLKLAKKAGVEILCYRAETDLNDYYVSERVDIKLWRHHMNDKHNLKLYHYWRSSCSWRVRWALEYKRNSI